MPDCVFCSVVEKNEPYHEILWQNERLIAFLDAFPAKDGHTLVISKVHAEDLLGLEQDLYAELMIESRRLATKMKNIFNATRVAVFLEGLSVPHVHVHVIPIHDKSDLALPNAALGDPEKLREIAERIKSGLNGE